MNRFAFSAWPLLVLSLGASACVASPEAATAESPAGAVGTASSAEAAESPQVHAGVAALLVDSLASLQVRPEQAKAIEQIRADVQANHEPLRAARRELALAVADGVAAGTLDEATLAARIARFSQSAAALAPSMQATMNKLHGTLDAAQRKALVDGMHAKAAAAREGAHEGGGHERLKRLAVALGLTQDQLKTIRAAAMAQAGGAERGEMMKQHEAMRDHLHAVGDAFVSETFDSAGLGVGSDVGPMASQAATHRLRFVVQLVPVLTPEQRTKLAGIIRARASAAEPSFEE